MSELMVKRLALSMMAYADTLKASSRDTPFIRLHRVELALAVIAEIEKDHVIVPRAEMQRLSGMVESAVSNLDSLPPKPTP
jgi:hypothetical protein